VTAAESENIRTPAAAVSAPTEYDSRENLEPIHHTSLQPENLEDKFTQLPFEKP